MRCLSSPRGRRASSVSSISAIKVRRLERDYSRTTDITSHFADSRRKVSSYHRRQGRLTHASSTDLQMCRLFIDYAAGVATTRENFFHQAGNNEIFRGDARFACIYVTRFGAFARYWINIARCYRHEASLFFALNTRAPIFRLRQTPGDLHRKLFFASDLLPSPAMVVFSTSATLSFSTTSFPKKSVFNAPYVSIRDAFVISARGNVHRFERARPTVAIASDS